MKFFSSFRIRFLIHLIMLSFLSGGVGCASQDSENSVQPVRRIIEIDTPIFTAEDPNNKYVAGLRPMRQDHPQIAAHSIFHHDKVYIMGECWGHGGAGITLAPGSAKLLFEKIFQQCNLNDIDLQKTSIGILGGGINGLWAAYHLLKQGIPSSHIYLYAKDFETTVSHIAAGMWLPISMPRGERHADFFQKLEDDSYYAYYKIAHKASKLEGVQELPLYTFNIEELPESFAQRGLVPKGEAVILKNQVFKEMEVVYWKGFFLVDPSLLLPSLQKYLKEKGVTFIQRFFQKEEEFLDLNKQVIINCLGFGNKYLLEKEKNTLYPSKGELIYLPPQSNIKYMLFGVIPGEKPQPFGIIPRKSELILGVTRKPGDESSEPNIEDTKGIFQTASKFFGYS